MSDNLLMAISVNQYLIKAIRVVAATFVASVISYGLVFILKVSAEFSWRPDCLDMSTWNGGLVFTLIQLLGLCFAIKIFGGAELADPGKD